MTELVKRPRLQQNRIANAALWTQREVATLRKAAGWAKGEELFSLGCSHIETVRTHVCIIDRRLYLTSCCLSCSTDQCCVLIDSRLSVLLRDRLKKSKINQTFEILNKLP